MLSPSVVYRGLRRTALVGLLTVLLSPMHSGAQKYSPAVAASLPPYCKGEVTGSISEEEIARWNVILGGGGMMAHIHHYCRGLAHTHHALFSAKNAQERIYALGYSINEFNYMLNNAGDTTHFKLLPEVLTKKGENLIRLKQFTEAMPVLLRAMEVKPDYWPPYAILSDYFRDMGDVPRAREWLDKGLAVAPESKALRSRQAELANAKGRAASAPDQKTSKRGEKPPVSEKSAARSAAPEAEPAPAAK